MTKKIVIVGILLLAVSYAEAQVNPHAIGLRLGGDGDINGMEISYQHGFSEKNRLELDLGFGGNSVVNKMFLAGIYHWNWNITEGLNWYVGPGAGLSLYNYRDDDDFRNDYADLAIGGQIGLEYDFNTENAPILLSLDFRPMWDFIGDGNYSGFGWGTALGVRYTW